MLRHTFAELLPDDDSYATMFDRTEIILGVISQDLNDARARALGRSPSRSDWFGRSTWRAGYQRVSPVGELAAEAQREGSRWKPLGAGLFGGDLDRFTQAFERYDNDFRSLASGRH